jgi:hypoxanthine phosphoribosyltransferase
MKSYDYAHRQGVKEISWDEFATMSARLAEELDKVNAEIIVGIARAGLFPAAAVACSLRRELYPVRVTRRVNDVVTYSSPVWKVPVSPDVSGKVVAVVDEITDTGETLAIAAQAVLERGAVRVVTACLVSHTWANPMPDVCALVSDALVIFPWDRQALVGGEWQLHPEIVAALEDQDGV